jgi:hypothetical protein
LWVQSLRKILTPTTISILLRDFLP